MSGEHSGRLVIMQSAAVDDPRVGNAAFRVLACLGTYSDRDGWCWPKLQTLADRLRVTKQAVSKSILQLEAMGYIGVERRYGEDGGQINSRYRLVLDYLSTEENLERIETLPRQPDVDPPSTSPLPPVNLTLTQNVTNRTSSEERGVSVSAETSGVDKSTPVLLRTHEENSQSAKDLVRKDAAARIFTAYKEKVQPKAVTAVPEKVLARLKTFTEGQIIEAFDHFAADEWWMTNHAHEGLAWMLRSDAQVERFLNLQPRDDHATTRRATPQLRGRLSGANGSGADTTDRYAALRGLGRATR